MSTYTSKSSLTYILYIIIYFLCIFNPCYSYEIFPRDKSPSEIVCESVSSPSLDTCTKIEVEEQYISCCFVTYLNKTSGDEFQKCHSVENTEFGLKVHKHKLGMYKKVKIQCIASYIDYKLIFSLFTLLFLL